MRREKRLAKLAREQAKHEEALASRPSLFVYTIFGAELFNLDGFRDWFRETGYRADMVAYHTVMFYLENGEFPDGTRLGSESPVLPLKV